MKRKFILALFLIFFLGLLTGGMIGIALAKRQISHMADLKIIGAIVKKELTSKLDLDPQQQQQVDPLVNRATDRIHGIYVDTLRRVDEVILDEQNQLVTYLRPDQVQKLSTVAKSREEFIRKHNPLESAKQ